MPFMLKIFVGFVILFCLYFVFLDVADRFGFYSETTRDVKETNPCKQPSRDYMMTASDIYKYDDGKCFRDKAVEIVPGFRQGCDGNQWILARNDTGITGDTGSQRYPNICLPKDKFDNFFRIRASGPGAYQGCPTGTKLSFANSSTGMHDMYYMYCNIDKCPDGYNLVNKSGKNICIKNPNHVFDIDSKIRALTCGKNDTYTKFAGMCYNKCRPGFYFDQNSISGNTASCKRERSEIDHKICPDDYDLEDNKCKSRCPVEYIIGTDRSKCIDNSKKTRRQNFYNKWKIPFLSNA